MPAAFSSPKTCSMRPIRGPLANLPRPKFQSPGSITGRDDGGRDEPSPDHLQPKHWQQPCPRRPHRNTLRELWRTDHPAGKFGCILLSVSALERTKCNFFPHRIGLAPQRALRPNGGCRGRGAAAQAPSSAFICVLSHGAKAAQFAPAYRQTH